MKEIPSGIILGEEKTRKKYRLYIDGRQIGKGELLRDDKSAEKHFTGLYYETIPQAISEGLFVELRCY